MKRKRNQKEKKRLVWVAFTQGGGLRGLALGFYHAASPRLRTHEFK
jgi:hypothetical protein